VSYIERTTRTDHTFENRVLRRIFGSKADEVTRQWRKLRNEELHNLYSSPNYIKVLKEGKNVYKVLIEKT
jgi:hypothetical protein